MSEITIDMLAGMMKNSFDHLEKKMDDRFEQVDRRFEQVDRRFDAIEIRLERIESKVNINQENRLSRVEDDIRIIKTKLAL